MAKEEQKTDPVAALDADPDGRSGSRKPSDAVVSKVAERHRDAQTAEGGDAEPGFGGEGSRTELGEPRADVDDAQKEEIAEHNRAVREHGKDEARSAQKAGSQPKRDG